MAFHSFVGREKELLAMRRELARDRPSVVIVLGRRRVGKSRLLLEATKDVPTIYYQATRVASSMSLSLFKREAEDVVGGDPVLDSLSDWLGVLTYLEGVARDRMPGLTVVLDEFPYLCDSDRALPSIFQKFSDRIREQGEPINLVLCGSKIAFMEELLAEKNPMHGRQTLELDLESLPYRDAALFFPEWTPDQQVQAYAVFGGVPYYLSLCDPARSLEENVRELVLTMGAPLADEPTNLLQAELRDVTRYASILRAIADGCTVSGDIISRVREIRNASGIAPYIQKLEELRLIRVVRSLDASERERDRRYYLGDPFLAFWFRFYLPNASALSAGHDGEVWHHAVEPFFDEYMGDLFEWVCRDHARLFAGEVLPTASQEVGQVWGSDYDIDVAGTLLDGSTYSGECKWWTDPIGENILVRLRDVTGRSSYFASATNHRYLLYSRSGFTEELELLAGDDPSVELVDLSRLLGRTAT